jgi:hypothetical protein
MSGLARRRLVLFASTVALLSVVSGCAKTSTTPVAPTPPVTDPVLTTEDFAGALIAQGSDVIQFTVSAAGTVRVTLTEIGPTDPVVLGLSVGLWDATNSVCTDIVKNESAQAGTTIVGRAEPGTFCSRVYDVGNVVDTEPYKLQVIHP